MPRENYVQSARPANAPQLPSNGSPPPATIANNSALRAVVVVALTVFAFIMVQLLLTSQNMANTKRLDQLDKELRETANVREDLEVKLNQAENIIVVEKEAKERLGMRPLRPSQIREVVVEFPKKEAVADVEIVEAENWFSRLLSFWR